MIYRNKQKRTPATKTGVPVDIILSCLRFKHLIFYLKEP